MLREEGDHYVSPRKSHVFLSHSTRFVSNQCPYPKTPGSHRRPHLPQDCGAFCHGSYAVEIGSAWLQT